MSSNSRWSFRARTKDKIQKFVQSNLTSSVREQIPLDNIREKSRNYTNIIKEQIHYADLKNKTKTYIDRVLPSNQTFADHPQGFFDSLFNPQTVNDVYFKTTIICLWTIAMISIVSTIITMFLPLGKNPSGAMRVKPIFFHIFLCEFCYLIYILLAMINVALDYHLNTFLCDVAEYGMYATVPIMCFTLLILSIERLANRCKAVTVTNKFLTNPFLIQIVLIVIWVLSIAIISLIVSLKNKVKNPLKRFFSSNNQCSIDGQLLPSFKILFLILFIVLIVLIIKSMVVTFVWNIFTPSCAQNKKEKKKTFTVQTYMTFIFVVFLFLNLILSSPFYIISTGSSISKLFNKQQTYSNTLKVTFIFRIISIILQCWIFCIYDNNTWFLLGQCIRLITMKKIDLTRTVRNERHRSNSSDSDLKFSAIENANGQDSDLSDDVFTPERTTVNNVKSKQIGKNFKSIKTKLDSSSDDDDDKQVKKPDKKQKISKKPIPSDSSSDSDDDDDQQQPKTSNKNQVVPKKSIPSDSSSDDEEKPRRVKETTITKPSEASEQKTTNHQQTSKDRKARSEEKKLIRKKRLYSNTDEV